MSLILSSLLTGVLGIVFWGAAGRLYPPREVGMGAAMINSAVMLSTLSILSIDTLYERFLPVAGSRAASMIKRGFLVVVATALLSGTALAIFGPREQLFESGWAMACYPLLVVVLAIFTLQDKTSVGLGVARWSAGKNSFHAVAKLAVLLVLAWTENGVAIVVAWGATAAAAAAVLLVAMRRRYRTSPQFQDTPDLPSTNQLWSYFGSSFGITALWVIGPLVVPLIVLDRFGAEANAYFAVTFAVVNALYFAVHLVIGPYVAEVAANPDKVASLSVRMVQTMAAVTVVGSAGLVFVGPFVLGLVGPTYRAEGQNLLFLAAAFIPLSSVGAIYEGFARVQRKLKLMVAVRCVSASVIVFGTLVATRIVGVDGVGWAYLAAESLSAAVLLVPVVLWLRRAKNTQVVAAAPL